MPRSCSLCVFRVSFRGCGPVPSPPGRFACAGEGVVKYPRRVACPSGRRCSTRNAVWCHSHPGFKSQRYRHCRPAPMGPGGFVMPSWRAVLLCGCVAPRVFRAPEAPAAVCAGGRRPAREARRPHCVRRRASKPAHALRSLRRPPHQWGWVADVCLRVVSKPGQASRLEARSILSFACNSLMPAVCGSVKSPEFQRLNFKA